MAGRLLWGLCVGVLVTGCAAGRSQPGHTDHDATDLLPVGDSDAAVGDAAMSAGDQGAVGDAQGSGDAGLPGDDAAPADVDVGDSLPVGGFVCDLPVMEFVHQPATPAAAYHHLVSLTEHPFAVCNDGTPGAYLFRPGVGAGVNRWLIYLEGGGTCETDDGCALRWQQTRGYMSNASVVDGALDTTVHAGIKSTDPSINPDFYDANLLQLDYCSSDTWSGDQAGDSDLPVSSIGRWHFRGRAILEAVLAEMLPQGLQQATEVLLTGSSAGGVGVFLTADDVHARLPASARFVALADAGFFIDYPSYDPATQTESTAPVTDTQIRAHDQWAHWGGRGDASCHALATTDEQQIHCRSAERLLIDQHLQVPLLVRNSQLDPVQLKKLIANAEQGEAATAYRARFAAKMRAQLAAIGPNYGAFASYDNFHGVINDAVEWPITVVGDLRVGNAIGLWYRDPCGQAQKWIAEP